VELVVTVAKFAFVFRIISYFLLSLFLAFRPEACRLPTTRLDVQTFPPNGNVKLTGNWSLKNSF
jgi:hypothetical protein